MAIPDHPWTKAKRDAAAVRIAMSVVGRGSGPGKLLRVVSEDFLRSDEPSIELSETTGIISSALSTGLDLTSATQLMANSGVCARGVQLMGEGFIVDAKTAGLMNERSTIGATVVPYVNGRDIAGIGRQAFAIDFFGIDEGVARSASPLAFQHLLEKVRPERETNNRNSYRLKWWQFGEQSAAMRAAVRGLPRFIITPRTAKHRVFLFAPASTLPDSKLVTVAIEDAWMLSILSSSAHTGWALVQGGFLEDRPTYQHADCFLPFPFPDPREPLRAELRAAGEELDEFRKARQAEHPRLTLTQMYNMREAIRAGRALTADEARIKDEGLVLILNELHDRIDRLTFDAYGWPHDLSDEAILERLVSLNRERAAEERRGLVRWLRPDDQKARAGVMELRPETAEMELTPAVAAKAAKPAFPKGAIDQGAAVAAALLAASAPVNAAAIAAGFKQGKRAEPRVAAILAAMARTGAAATRDGGETFLLRRAA